MMSLEEIEATLAELEDIQLRRLGPAALQELQRQIRLLMEQLAAQQPEDMEGEAFEAWAEPYERLEDLADNVADYLAR